MWASTLSEALLWGCAITGMGAVMIRPSASRYLGRMMHIKVDLLTNNMKDGGNSDYPNYPKPIVTKYSSREKELEGIRNMSRRNAIHHVPRKNIIHAPRKVIKEPSTIYCALNASFAICRKNRKIVARKLGAKCKGDKTCIWVPKTWISPNCLNEQ